MQPQDGNEQYQQPAAQAGGAPYQAAANVQSAPVSPEPAAPVPDETASMDEQPAITVAEDDGAVVRWDGPEYISQPHGTGWYAAVAAVTLALMAAAIFFFQSPTFAVLVPVMAAALVIYTRREPQTINYTVSHQGIHANDRLYPYDLFKSFSVSSHNGTHSLILIPRKRFEMALTAYFPEEVGEPLVDMMAARLPMQTHTPDFMDKILSKLHL